MPELLIRPSRNDHKVVADLLAPGGAAIVLPNSRALIDRLVLDAPMAALHPELAEVAATAGTGVLVDPLTFLWQDETKASSGWAQLPFGSAAKLTAQDLCNPFTREALIEQVVQFQIEHGASAIIPPYPYVTSVGDAFFDVAIDLLAATASYLRRNSIALPVLPILCARNAFAGERAWTAGLDRFINAALDIGPEAIGLCLTPLGAQDDSYSKVVALFTAMLHVKGRGVKLIAWRQGIYGPGLVAAGIDGYETGIGVGEKADVSGYLRARRPPKPGSTPSSGGGGTPIYLEPFHRSFLPEVAETLLGDRAMRARILCEDERCCPDGVNSTLDHRREHAVRSRARELAMLEGLPHTSWRLHQIAKDARSASTLAKQANQVLKREKVRQSIKTAGYEALAQTTDYLRDRYTKAA